MERFGGTRNGDRIDMKSTGARGLQITADGMVRDAITMIGRADARNGVRVSWHRDDAIVFARAIGPCSGVASVFRDEIPLFCRDVPQFSANVPQHCEIAPFIRCDVPQQNNIVCLIRRNVPQFLEVVPQQGGVVPQQRGILPQQSGVVPLFRGKTSLFPTLVALQRLDEAMYSHEPCAGAHAGSPKPGHRSTVFR